MPVPPGIGVLPFSLVGDRHHRPRTPAVSGFAEARGNVRGMSLLANNAIGWANLQITGGWRRLLWVMLALAVGLPLLIYGSTQFDDPNPRTVARTMAGWLSILAFLQGGLLLVGVPSRVFGAIKRDRITRVIESHRLMPTPAAHAIAGYIVGPNLMLLSWVATIFAVGLVLAVPAQQDWRGWIALHVAALGVSAMLGCVIAFSAHWLPRFNPAVVTLFLFPALSVMSATAMLPAARVLLAPYLGSGLAALQRGEINLLHVAGFASQALVSAILFIGACRRYRRDDVPALGFFWGWLLLALWILLGLLGSSDLLMWEQPFGGSLGAQTDRLAFIIHLSLTLLMAMGPITAAAAASLAWRRRKSIDPHFIDRRPVGLLLATPATFAVLCLIALTAPRSVGPLAEDYDGFKSIHGPGWFEFAMTFSQILVFVVTVALLAHGAARLTLQRSAFLIVPWIVLTWIVPPIMDLLLSYFAEQLSDLPTATSAVSPPLCIAAIWSGRHSAAIVGLATQAALAGLLGGGWVLLKRFNMRHPSSTREAPAA